MARLWTLMKKEIWSIIPAVIYFAICFNLIFFTGSLIFRNHDIPNPYTYWTVDLGALIVGKVIIIVNTFPFLNAFPNKPLIYNIIWKFFIYGIAVFLFRIGDNFVRASLHYHSWSLGWLHLETSLQSSKFWAIELWLFLLFFLFIFYNELVDKIGRDTVRKMIFG
ncbi:MAG: hypothetical protein V4501_02315 [Pseudomonadota bacterium]